LYVFADLGHHLFAACLAIQNPLVYEFHMNRPS
jgi:hypothetical protein